MIRQAGESVRRVESRTPDVLAQRLLHPGQQVGELLLLLALGLALVTLGVEVDLALGDRLQRFAVELVTVPTQTSSTGSVSSKTS